MNILFYSFSDNVCLFGLICFCDFVFRKIEIQRSLVDNTFLLKQSADFVIKSETSTRATPPLFFFVKFFKNWKSVKFALK